MLRGKRILGFAMAGKLLEGNEISLTMDREIQKQRYARH